MLPLGVQVVFEPPRWPVVLTVAAGMALLWEAVSLGIAIWRNRTVGERIAPMDVIHGGLVPPLGALVVFWPTGGSVIALAACGILWAIRGYGATTSPVRRRTKGWLLAARIAALFLLACWVLGPGLEFQYKQDVRGVVLVGVDTSGSMQRFDMPPAYTDRALVRGTDPIRRIEAVRQAMEDQGPALKALSEKADVEVFNFSATAEPPVGLVRKRGQDPFVVGDANGLATALGDSIAAAFDPYNNKGRRVVGIILISDGCNNASDVVEPETEARVLRQRNVPVHTVGVGSEKVTGSMRMLTVKELAAPAPGKEEVQRFNSLPITATVDAIGLKDKQVKVTAKFEDQLVGEETYGVDSEQHSIPVRFVHVPLTAGLQRVTVTAECVDVVPNLSGVRTATKLVRVTDNELRVLYVEGKFRFEAKYVMQALVAAQRFSIDRRVLLQPLRAGEAPTFSEKLEDWLMYHAIIFGDVSASHFTPKQTEIIKELVGKYGKGFCMIGGSQSFGRGGWGETPVADIMPIDLKRSDKQIEGEVKVVPTRDGLAHDILRVGAESETVAAAWAKLPPLPGADRLEGVKEAAAVLAETPQKEPLIVAQKYGAGRTLAIAFDTTWRWVVNAEDIAELQRRFWRQVTLFLSDPKGHVWVTTEKTSYELRRLISGAETVEVTAGVEDFQGRPLMDVTVDATMTPPGGQPMPIRLETKGTSRQVKLAPPSEPGIYALRISATVADKPMTAEHRFEVVQRDLESLDVLANHKLLRQMSEITGGQYVPLADLPELLKELSIETQPERVPVIVHKGLMEELHWPMVAAIILLLCVEWSIRKRKGLV